MRNLIDEAVDKRLPFQPKIRDPGNVRVIGGNGEALDLKGFSVLPISLRSNLIWHEFGIVLNLPLEVLIGADVLAPHLCSLHYLHNNNKRLQLGVQVCEICKRYRSDPEVGTSTQMKFIDYNPNRRRNRLKIGYYLLATLPEVFCDELNEQNDLQIEQNKEIPSPLIEFKVSSAGFKDISPKTPSTSATREVTPSTSNMKTEIHSIQNQSENKTSIKQQQSGKLQREL